MSKFDVESALAGFGIKYPIVEERLRRSISDYYMGKFVTTKPDPTYEFNPVWISKTHKPHSKITTAKLGLKNIDATPPPGREYVDELSFPNDAAVSIFLQRMGYGDKWPPLPAPTFNVPTEQDKKFAGKGIVDETLYKENISPLAALVIDYSEELYKKLKFEGHLIEATVLRLLEDPEGRGRPQTRERNEAAAHEDETKWTAVLKESWQKAVKELRDRLHLAGTTMDLDENVQPLSHHPDLDIVKAALKDTELLYNGGAVVPFIDFKVSSDASKVQAGPGQRTDDAKEAARREYYEWARRVRGALLVPHVNFHDLSVSDNILTLLWSRAHSHPAAFLSLDLEATHVGRMTRILRGMFCGSTAVLLERISQEDGKESYGVCDPLLPNFWFTKQGVGVHGSEVLGRPELCNYNPRRRHPAIAVNSSSLRPLESIWKRGRLLGTGEAQVVLLSQALTYAFLVCLCQGLKSEYDDTTDLPSPSENGNHLKCLERHRAIQEKRLKLHSEITTEYVPKGRPSLGDFIDKFIGAWDNDRNIYRDIFSDPDVFWKYFQDERDHHYAHLNGLDDNDRLSHLDDDASEEQRHDIYYDIIGNILRRGLLGHVVASDIKKTASAQRRWYQEYAELGPELDRLEARLRSLSEAESTLLSTAPVDLQSLAENRRTWARVDQRFQSCGQRQIYLAQQGRAVHLSLANAVREYYLFYLNELVCRGKFVASPPVRDYFARVTPKEDILDGEGKLPKTLFGFPRMFVKKRPLAEGEKPMDPAKEEVIHLIYDMLSDPIVVTVVTMKRILDGIKIMMWDQAAASNVTNVVMQIINAMSLLVEFAMELNYSLDRRDELESCGLGDVAFNDENGVFPKEADARTDIRWIATFSLDQVAGSAGMLALDKFAYESWKEIPRKRYQRIYEWLDEKSKPNGQPKSNKEMGEELGKFGVALFEGLKDFSMPAPDLHNPLFHMFYHPHDGPRKYAYYRCIDDDVLEQIKEDLRVSDGRIGSRLSSPDSTRHASGQALLEIEILDEQLRGQASSSHGQASEENDDLQTSMQESVQNEDDPPLSRDKGKGIAHDQPDAGPSTEDTSRPKGKGRGRGRHKGKGKGKGKEIAHNDPESEEDLLGEDSPVNKGKGKEIAHYESDPDIMMEDAPVNPLVQPEAYEQGEGESSEVYQMKVTANRQRAFKRSNMVLRITGPARARTTSSHRRLRRQQREAELQRSRSRHSHGSRPSQAASSDVDSETRIARETAQWEREEEESRERRREEQREAEEAEFHANKIPRNQTFWRNVEALFHKGAGQRGALTWSDLTLVMTNLGYAVTQQNGGSMVTFSWTEACPWPAEVDTNDGRRDNVGSFLIHRQHNNSAILAYRVQDIQYRLERRGLTLDLIETYFRER